MLKHSACVSFPLKNKEKGEFSSPQLGALAGPSGFPQSSWEGHADWRWSIHGLSQNHLRSEYDMGGTETPQSLKGHGPGKLPEQLKSPKVVREGAKGLFDPGSKGLPRVFCTTQNLLCAGATPFHTNARGVFAH